MSKAKELIEQLLVDSSLDNSLVEAADVKEIKTIKNLMKLQKKLFATVDRLNDKLFFNIDYEEVLIFDYGVMLQIYERLGTIGRHQVATNWIDRLEGDIRFNRVSKDELKLSKIEIKTLAKLLKEIYKAESEAGSF